MTVNYTKLPAVLLLEDGTVYHGKAAGKIGTTTGEICFNTGMTGYQEIFTDPSYFGQIMVTTNAHIGNYGIHEDEVESGNIKIAGLVCKNFNIAFSRKQSETSIQDYFQEENIVGISDVDTRSLVRHIRDKGAMNAIISSETLDLEELRKKLADVPSMDGLELSSKVSTTEPYLYGDQSASHRVAVLDLGIKKNILRNFDQRHVHAKVFPAKTSFKEMEEWGPDGYFISNGPGDPAAMPYAVDTVKEILKADKPLFGICLGHQLLALANDIHRSDKVEITHVNLNDQSIEGIRVKGKKAFSVQYHPESSPGPHDSRYLFDDFVKMMEQK